VKGLADKIITLGKTETLPARRRALAYVYDDKVVAKIFGELAQRFAERKGGYTRIVKLGPRQGDSAPVVRLELLQ